MTTHPLFDCPPRGSIIYVRVFSLSCIAASTLAILFMIDFVSVSVEKSNHVSSQAVSSSFKLSLCTTINEIIFI